MPWRSAYTDAVLSARADYEEGLLPDLLEALAYEYAQMLDDVARDVGRGVITAERADALYLSIIDRLEEVTLRLGRTFDRAQLEAAQLGAAGHAEGFQAARAVAGSTLTQSFATVPQRAVELMIARRPRGIASTFQALISRNLESMAGEVDRYLTSAVARGVSGQRGAVELAQLLARNDPAVLDVLQRFNGSMARAMREGVPEDLVLRGRSLLQDTRRIMVTETNTAYFEADRVGALESPVVKYVRWTLSGRHYGLPSSPDSCTILATTNRSGFGVGVFHPSNAPSKQHPYCLLPGTVVQGDIKTAIRSYFSGDAVDIETGKGKLSLTFNHPVLTARGLVRAGELVHGDKLIAYGGQVDARALIGFDVDEPPTLAEDVFDSFAKDGPGFSIERSAEYLHGEARFGKGNIDIVVPYGELLFDFDTKSIKHDRKLRLIAPEISEVGVLLACALEFFRSGMNPTTSSLVSLLRPSLAGLRIFGKAKLPRDFTRFGHASYLDTVLDEDSSQNRSAYSCFLSKLLDRFSGTVSLDEVRGIRKYNFTGHVYDFTTVTGYVVANNILISNCACSLHSVLRPPEEWGQPKPNPREPVYASAAETRRALLEAQERVRATGGRPRSLTDKYLMRQRETVNLYLRLADEAARVPA